MPQGIGFIGLGIMGQGMAARLVSQGVAGTADVPLVVWNRSDEKCKALAETFPDATIIVAESAAAVVQACDVTYSMLSTPEAAAAVFDAPDVGTLAGISTGKAIVDCATLAQEDMQRMNEAVTAKGGYVNLYYFEKHEIWKCYHCSLPRSMWLSFSGRTTATTRRNIHAENR